MTEFTIHTVETAPSKESREMLEDALRVNGMIPNIFGAMAEAPKVLEAYRYLGSAFNGTSFSPVERNVVWLEINVLNECTYCVPAHTAIAYGAKVPRDVVEALRNREPIGDERLEALRLFTRKVIEKKGRVNREDVFEFMDAGYTKAHVLEVILGAAHKTLSNYINHIVDTPVDDAFQKFAWEPRG